MRTYEKIRNAAVTTARETLTKHATTAKLKIQLEYYPQQHPMADADLDQFVTLENQCFPPGMSDAPTKAAMIKYLARSEVILIRNSAQKPAAIIAAILFHEDEDFGEELLEIEDLVVCESTRGNGYGEFLLKTVTIIADHLGWRIKLEAPPWNQSYYKRKCDFDAVRSGKDQVWKIAKTPEAKDPLLLPKIKMYRMPKASPYSLTLFEAGKKKSAFPDDKDEKKETPKKTIHEQIEVIRKLAKFAESKTSSWYRSFGHSAEKERAQESIQFVLAYRLAESEFPQQGLLPSIPLKKVVLSILKNAFKVRGWNLSAMTASGEALFRLFSENTPQGDITLANIQTLRELLNFDEQAYQSYENLRQATYTASPAAIFNDADLSPYAYF